MQSTKRIDCIRTDDFAENNRAEQNLLHCLTGHVREPEIMAGQTCTWGVESRLIRTVTKRRPDKICQRGRPRRRREDRVKDNLPLFGGRQNGEDT